jgi:hypothetical protein
MSVATNFRRGTLDADAWETLAPGARDTPDDQVRKGLGDSSPGPFGLPWEAIPLPFLCQVSHAAGGMSDLR